jgi:type II secretory pathway component GspD/PulD (secretin)
MNHLKLTHKILISFMCNLMLLSVSHAERFSDEKWSFDFNNVSVVDAFNEIKRQTGMEIVVRQKTIQPVMVTYHSKNQSIMQLHQDLLRNVNHSSSWKYADDGTLKSLHIVILGRGDRNDNLPVSNSVHQPSGMTDEQNNLRTKLVKPPEAPKTTGLRSPPMPPGS